MSHRRFRASVIDFIEQNLSAGDESMFREHLSTCRECREEVAAYRRLYNMLDRDPVAVPAEPYFEQVRAGIRRLEPKPGRKVWWLAAGIAVPAAAAVAIFFLFENRYATVEMSVDVSGFVQDREVSRMLLEKLVDEPLADRLISVEKYYSTGIDESLDELDAGERDRLMDMLDGLCRPTNGST